MQGGVLVNARPLHKVLSLGHVWLLFIVCACWGNTGLVKGRRLLVSKLYLTPLDIMHLCFPMLRRDPGNMVRSKPHTGLAFPTRVHAHSTRGKRV